MTSWGRCGLPNHWATTERKVVEDLKIIGAMKTTFNVRSVRFDVRRELHERVVKSTVTYEAET